MTHRLRFLVTLALIVSPLSVLAADVQQSEADSRNLAWISDPDTLYFAPGNTGEAYFQETPNPHPGNLQSWQDEYSNAKWIALDSENYNIRLTGDSETSSAEYWQIQQGILYNTRFTGTAIAWVADEAFLNLYRLEPRVCDDITSHIRQFRAEGLSGPALVMDFPEYNHETKELINRLRAADSSLAVHITPGSFSTVPRRGWTFVICDEEVIPETYRGQSAAAWVQSIFGQVPVVISPSRPRFLRDVIWLSTGAAGLWYRPLPDPETQENQDAAIQLRGTTAFLNRFQGAMALTSSPIYKGINFNLVDEGHSFASIIPSGSGKFLLPLPGWLQNQTVRQVWFNPATDENIIQPLTRTGSNISFQLPDDNLWVYSLTRTNAAPDTETTVSAIRPLPAY